jgi:hypothetical protein
MNPAISAGVTAEHRLGSQHGPAQRWAVLNTVMYIRVASAVCLATVRFSVPPSFYLWYIFNDNNRSDWLGQLKALSLHLCGETEKDH